MRQKLNKLLADLNDVEAVFKSEASWRTKFDAIFQLNDAVCPLVKELNLTIDWTDPDASYEEDVRAYVEGAMKLRDEVHRLLAALGSDEEVEVVVTVGALVRKRAWDKFCEMRGLNPWALKEGLADKSDKFTLSGAEARELGFVIAE